MEVDGMDLARLRRRKGPTQEGPATKMIGVSHDSVTDTENHRRNLSELDKTGIPINSSSARMGHANPPLTHNVYAHLLPGTNRRSSDTRI